MIIWEFCIMNTNYIHFPVFLGPPPNFCESPQANKKNPANKQSFSLPGGASFPFICQQSPARSLKDYGTASYLNLVCYKRLRSQSSKLAMNERSSLNFRAT